MKSMIRCVTVILLLSSLFPLVAFGQEVKVGMIRNPGQYTEDIRSGFADFLRRSPLNLNVKDEQGFALETDSEKNILIAENLLKWGADLIVTIGSSASHAIGNHYKGKKIPVLFMGITDPVQGGLLTSMSEPGRQNITGVTFPMPLKRKMETLQKIFPNARAFCFVYDSRLPPDVMYMNWIRDYVKNNSKPVIRFLDTDKDKGIPDTEIKQSDVFFGWYSVHLYQHASKYPNLQFVGATVHGCREGAVVSIYPKLYELGEQGGEMALKILRDKVSPGDILAEHPRQYGICFNQKKIQEFGLKIPKGFLELADLVIDE